MEETTLNSLIEQFVELLPRPFLETVNEVKANYQMKNLKWLSTQSVTNFKIELTWDIYENSPTKIRKRVKLLDQDNNDNKSKSIKLEPLQTVQVKIEQESPKIGRFASSEGSITKIIDKGTAEQTQDVQKSLSQPKNDLNQDKIPNGPLSTSPSSLTISNKSIPCTSNVGQAVNHCINNGATVQKADVPKSSSIPPKSILAPAPPKNDANPEKIPSTLSSKTEKKIAQSSVAVSKIQDPFTSGNGRLVGSCVNNGWRNVVLESVIYEMYNGTVVIYGGDWHTGEGVYFSFPSLYYTTEGTVISSLDNYYDFWDMDAWIRAPSVRTISGYNAYPMPCFITAQSLCKRHNNPHVYQCRY
ncbi:hypothetical protein SNE40_001374 [Patella caerulea]|uniref:Uncharacterized protein n=1 Tax=Patella caerulea TaxID=87958 RepID=A0AAN8QI04_PATCE